MGSTPIRATTKTINNYIILNVMNKERNKKTNKKANKIIILNLTDSTNSIDLSNVFPLQGSDYDLDSENNQKQFDKTKIKELEDKYIDLYNKHKKILKDNETLIERISFLNGVLLKKNKIIEQLNQKLFKINNIIKE